MADLEALHKAIQTFSNELAEGDPDDVGMVTNALVVWEESSYSDDGQIRYATHYATTGGGSTPSACLGLAANLLRTLERDIVPIRCSGDV